MTDRVLFIEDSGLIWKPDITQLIVAEAAQKTISNKSLILKKVPSTVLGEKNANGRIYSEAVIAQSIEKLRRLKAFENRTLHCTANNHPKETYVPPTETSHVIIDAYPGKDKKGRTILYTDWLVTSTDAGRNLRALAEDGIAWGTSIRGLGSYNEKTSHIENYDFLGCDGVGNPSAGTFNIQENADLTESFTVSVEYIENVDSSRHLDVQGQKVNRMNPYVQSVVDFIRTTHYKGESPPTITVENRSNIVADLLQCEGTLISRVTRDEMAPFLEMKNSILGTAPVSEFTENSLVINNSPRNNRVTSESNMLVTHLENAVRDLTAERDSYKSTAAAGSNLINALSERIKGLPDQITKDVTEKLTSQFEKTLEELKVSNNDTTTTTAESSLKKSVELVESIIAKSIKTVEDVINSSVNLVEQLLQTSIDNVHEVQVEAFEKITSLETRLDASIAVGDTVSEYVVSLSRINRALVSSLQEVASRDNKGAQVIYTARESRVPQNFRRNTMQSMGR